MESLMTIKEAAEYLGFSVSKIYALMAARRLPHVKIGKALRFDPADLRGFVQASKVKTAEG